MPPADAEHPCHDEIVRHVAQVLIDKGFSDIRANIEGHKAPAGVTSSDRKQQCVPDLAARGQKMMLIEVETEETLGSVGPGERWPLLSKFAASSNADFIVIVPESIEEDAGLRAKELGASAQIIGI